MNSFLQEMLDTQVCTILVQLDSDDPTDKLTKEMTELKILEDEMKKMQRNLDDTKKILKII